MEKIIKNIQTKLPKIKSGFSFRKSQLIYIPYLQIGIECLIRDISEINLFFETILSLLNIGVTDVKQISEILGISFEIVKEVIVDMVEGNYVKVSENKLYTTNKGIEAIKTKKLIETKKKYLNKVMIDLITGDIYDGSNIKCDKVTKYNICLDKQIDVSKSYLDSKYSSINAVFKQQQESDGVFGKVSINKELYKIIGISCENLVYVGKKLLIYQSDNSGEIQIEVQNDINDQYLNSLYSQLKDGTHPCLDNFFEKDFKFLEKYNENELCVDQELLDTTKEVYTDLSCKENINTELFMKNRYMLTDTEYENYFIYSDEIYFDKLIIITNRVNSILTTTIFEQINKIALKKPVILIYNKNEFNAKKQIEHFLNINEKSKNIIIIESDNIVECKIFFESSLEISIKENVISAFSRSITYKAGVISFDVNYNNNELKSIMSEYKIEKLISRQNNMKGVRRK